MKPVWIEGEGVITDDGSFYAEANVRAAVEVINRFCLWFESLPVETQDIIKWESELR